jgi:hypothetical protein
VYNTVKASKDHTSTDGENVFISKVPSLVQWNWPSNRILGVAEVLELSQHTSAGSNVGGRDANDKPETEGAHDSPDIVLFMRPLKPLQKVDQAYTAHHV